MKVHLMNFLKNVLFPLSMYLIKLMFLLQIIMGKNKNKKLNSVFKVAGAKSLKIKTKAKAVKSDLKKINLKNQKKVRDVDKELVNLQEKIHNLDNLKKKSAVPKVKKPLPSKVATTQDVPSETLAQLDSMQL